mmetsp:Transcript_23125/g.54675  ORF Transcript_23125/g.54675 Transcript_23125/m.54675 type:complete len:80 (+) Transcript_23125:176-415(+)
MLLVAIQYPTHQFSRTIFYSLGGHTAIGDNCPAMSQDAQRLCGPPFSERPKKDKTEKMNTQGIEAMVGTDTGTKDRGRS